MNSFGTKQIFFLVDSNNFISQVSKPSHCQVNKEIFEHDGHTVDAYWIDHRQENLQKKSDKILRTILSWWRIPAR